MFKTFFLRLWSYLSKNPVPLGTIIDIGIDTDLPRLCNKKRPAPHTMTGRISLGETIELYPLGLGEAKLDPPDYRQSPTRYVLIYVPTNDRVVISRQESESLIDHWCQQSGDELSVSLLEPFFPKLGVPEHVDL